MIEALPEKLFWGDITTQGLPFYAGNVTYLATLPDGGSGAEGATHRGGAGGPVAGIQVADFAGPVLDVTVGGRMIGSIGWAPFVVELPQSSSWRSVIHFIQFYFYLFNFLLTYPDSPYTPPIRWAGVFSSCYYNPYSMQQGYPLYFCLPWPEE